MSKCHCLTCMGILKHRVQGSIKIQALIALQDVLSQILGVKLSMYYLTARIERNFSVNPNGIRV